MFFFKKIFLLSILSILTACATELNIDKNISEIKNHINQNQKESIDTSFIEEKIEKSFSIKENKEFHKENSLKLKEKGSLLNFIGSTQKSMAAYNKAINQFKRTTPKEIIGTYNDPFYEKTLLRSYQTLNFLLSNQKNKALVEANAFNSLQKLINLNHERIIKEELIKQKEKLLKGNKETKTSSKDTSEQIDLINSTYKEISPLNEFSNSFSYYISGLTRELNNDRNGAYIDYKRAYKLNPHNSYIQGNLYKLSKSYGVGKEKDNFNNYKKQVINTKNKLIIFYQQGRIPKMKKRTETLIINNDYIQIHLPTYEITQNSIKNNNINFLLTNKDGISSSYQTQVLTDNFYLAATNLKNKLPSIYLKQYSKAALALSAIKLFRSKQRNLIEELAFMATMAISFDAITINGNVSIDGINTQTWRTLPKTIQLAELPLSDNFKNLLIEIPKNIKNVYINEKKEKIIENKINIDLNSILKENKNIIANLAELGNTLLINFNNKKLIEKKSNDVILN